MTYARARLWLGVTGVGSLVTIAGIALTLGLPRTLLASNKGFGVLEMLQLTAVTGSFTLWITPLDFLGGYWLPSRFQKSEQVFDVWHEVKYCGERCRWNKRLKPQKSKPVSLKQKA